MALDLDWGKKISDKYLEWVKDKLGVYCKLSVVKQLNLNKSLKKIIDK
jgi:hypothetical protein